MTQYHTSTYLVETLDRASPARLELYGLHPANLPLPHVHLQHHLLFRHEPLQRPKVRPTGARGGRIRVAYDATKQEKQADRQTSSRAQDETINHVSNVPYVHGCSIAPRSNWARPKIVGDRIGRRAGREEHAPKPGIFSDANRANACVSIVCVHGHGRGKASKADGCTYGRGRDPPSSPSQSTARGEAPVVCPGRAGSFIQRRPAPSHVVGVEKVELLDELISSLRGHRAQLHHLGFPPVPDDQAPRRVGPRALDRLDRELCLLVEDVVKHVEVDRGPEVVDVADEDVLLALLIKRGKATAAQTNRKRKWCSVSTEGANYGAHNTLRTGDGGGGHGTQDATERRGVLFRSEQQ